jgi:hypothetical protein
MSDNTFQEQLITYLGGTTGPTFGPGMTGSNIESTSSNEFVVGWQGPAAPISANAGTSCGIELKSLPNSGASLIDFHSTPGYFNNTYDFRMQCSGGATGVPGIGQMICLGSVMDIRCPINVGNGGKLFKVDFSTTVATVGVNQVTTISFTPGIFTVAPTVVATANTPTGHTGDQFVHVEEVTASSFKVEYLGTAAAGTFINWIALGL